MKSKFPFCAVTREELDAMVIVQHDDEALQTAIPVEEL